VVKESPLPPLARHVENHVPREHRVGDVEDLPLEAADGGAVPPHVYDYTLHTLHTP